MADPGTGIARILSAIFQPSILPFSGRHDMRDTKDFFDSPAR